MMSVRIGTITVDCEDPHRLAGFWSTMLGVAVTEIGEDYAELANVADGAPNLLFLKVPEAKSTKNRLHLDLMTEYVAAATEQALNLGATRAEGDLAGPFEWVVLLDPEGNEFCICPAAKPSPSDYA